jgi:hypothetical protein
MKRPALSVWLSGMALITAPLCARAEPPPPDSAASAAPLGASGTASAAAPRLPSPRLPSPRLPSPRLPSAPPPPTASYPSPAFRRDPTLPPADETLASSKYWYGWQTWTVAGGAGLVFAASTVVDSLGAPSNFSFGGYLLAFGGSGVGSAIVHFAHGNVGKGFASFGIHVAGVISGAMTGFILGGGGHGGNGGIGALLGSSLGSLSATVVDSTVFAYGRREPARHGDAALRRPPMALVPTLDLRTDRASVGLSGTF